MWTENCVYERALIKADGSNNEAVVAALKDYYDAHKDQVHAEVADGPGYKVIYMCVCTNYLLQYSYWFTVKNGVLSHIII